MGVINQLSYLGGLTLYVYPDIVRVSYPSEKYEFVSWDYYPNKCSKPPTRIYNLSLARKLQSQWASASSFLHGFLFRVIL
jgi:hypothetical protein